jgi:hypothetical protein
MGHPWFVLVSELSGQVLHFAYSMDSACQGGPQSATCRMPRVLLANGHKTDDRDPGARRFFGCCSEWFTEWDEWT